MEITFAKTRKTSAPWHDPLLRIKGPDFDLVVDPVAEAWGEYQDDGLVRTGSFSEALRSYLRKALADMARLRTNHVTYAARPKSLIAVDDEVPLTTGTS